MKFSTRKDVEAPIEFVFDRLTDFASYERQALRRGIKVSQNMNFPKSGVGTRWDVAFDFRGKQRRLQATAAKIEAPNLLEIATTSTGVTGDLEVELLPLSKNRTRIRIGLDVRPKTLTARLMIQSLKFARAKLDNRFEQKVEEFAKDTSQRYKSQMV